MQGSTKENRRLPRRADLAPGDRVMITARMLRGLTGTLIRPSRLLNGKRAWLVELDDRKNPLVFRGKGRVAEWYLQKVPEGSGGLDSG